MSIKRHITHVIVLALLVISTATSYAQPNVIVIVIDDAGFTDLGAYGSEINTPAIDSLAESGVMFSNFHAGPTCAPSRAMLMTGVPSHRAGLATLNHLRPEEHAGHPAYQGELAPDVPTIAEHLQAAGYASYITGKWHLGHSPQSLPVARGFDRSFILDASGADNWSQRSYLPQYEQADWFEGAERGTLPDDFYSSEFLVDKTIEYIDQTPAGQPFFSVIGFQAIHIPVQAPREFIDRYNGVYDEGWEVLRQRRHQAAIARGLIPADAQLGPVPDVLRRWEDLSARERERSIRSMQVNAGMLEAMDYHVGRLLDHLKTSGDYDNTVFMVLSDNGPEHNHPTADAGFRLWLWLEGFSQDIETLGEPGSYASIGPEWAIAAGAGGSLFKFHASEGGTRVPLVMSGPGIPSSGALHPFSFITDLVPTILELTGAEALDSGPAFTGRSLVDVLQGRAQSVYGPEDAVSLEASGQSAVFKGDYKLVRNLDLYGDGVWRLHNVVQDPGETRDLSAELPELFADMMREYELYTAEYGVLPMPPGYSGQQMIAEATTRQIIAKYGMMLLVAVFGVVLALLILFYVLFKRPFRSIH
ncbi:arylsulfatase [Pseudohongiella spirulinae]|uniref:Sulfatase n=1 Tax=Pseudohongiella spirulinae TaxID=1249552 RepID=A0A0S2KGH4_9GAMM|nr:arylsulfatase [Pseudohongiella spirulinae]ALO47447.1 Sulfatase [Pseudohongiella spirulinae]